MTSLKVYHLPAGWGLASVSPFCLKLDAFLRMTGIEHEAITAKTPFGSPTRRAPWIEHEGRIIPDSGTIIHYLKKRFDDDPDSDLTMEQRAQSLAIQHLVEDNLYWAMVYDRWMRPENWSILKASVLGDIPFALRLILAPIARRGVKRQYDNQAIGTHSEAGMEEIAKRDINALAALLGDQDYFHGGMATGVDACVFSLLANIHYVDFASPMKTMIDEHDNLVAFLKRFKQAVYPVG